MRHRSERDRRREDEQDALRPQERSILAMGLRPEAGNQAIGRMIARVKQKKVEGGRKVDYAENRTESTDLCRKYAATNKVVWDDLDEHVRESILGIAEKPTFDDGSPAGLEQAYQMIQTERRDAEHEHKKQQRALAMSHPRSDYAVVRGQIQGVSLLEEVVDAMRDRYVGGEPGTINTSIGTRYSRADVATAVMFWAGLVLTGLTVFTDPHGFDVGPKDSNVGATLARRGDQGNIIASWGGQKINVHIDPSD